MRKALVTSLGAATAIVLAACTASEKGETEPSQADVRPAAADAIAACAAWRQYVEPEPGQSSTDELLPLAESDAHSAAEKSAEYARLGAAIHDAVHRLVATGGATSPPGGPVPDEVLAAATAACAQVPREYEPQ